MSIIISSYNYYINEVISIIDENIFNKNDYKILTVLMDNQCYSKIASLTYKQISNNTKLSIPKIRISIKNFTLLDLIAEGAKDGISHTFYITEKGIDFLRTAMNINEGDE